MSTPGNPALVNPLQDFLRAECPIPFDRFMEAALYQPGLGYYSQADTSPGRHGDFYTSVSTGPVFGTLLANHTAHLWANHFPNKPLVLVEQGAHFGRLALDILDSFQKSYGDLYASCRYLMIEPQASLRVRQEKMLAKHQAKLEFLPRLPGWIKEEPVFFLSNELVDSFPVKRISYHSSVWQEAWVAWDEAKGEFREEWKPIGDSGLLDEIKHWAIPEINGYQTEVSLQARTWMKELAATLQSGFILTMDYGFLAPELYKPSRKQGTLSCYSGHRRDDRPLLDPGTKDMTSHINFSLLQEEGDKAGWKTLSFQDQHHALIEISQLRFLKDIEQQMSANPRDPEAQKAIRQFQTLTHPGIMGTQFQFLLQAKGLQKE